MMIRTLLVLSLVLSFMPGCAGSPAKAINAKAPPGTGLSVHKLQLSDGSTKNVSIFVPYQYDATKAWPTIVFLQGLGEGGSDGVKNTTVGLAPAIKKRAAKFDFIAVFPQSGGTWSSDGSQRLVINVLDAASRKFNIDPKRTYLTGLSTGGYGTWAIGAKFASRFAAIVPMCAYNGEAYADMLTNMPIWAFHNAGDPFVLAGSTKSTVSKINKQGGKAKQTIYGGLGHNCWDRAYSDDALYAWLKQQSK
jgi:predicted peptidase